MFTWGLGFLSVGALLIAYRQWALGAGVALIGIAMMFFGRKLDKQNAKKKPREE